MMSSISINSVKASYTIRFTKVYACLQYYGGNMEFNIIIKNNFCLVKHFSSPNICAMRFSICDCSLL